MIRKGWNEVAAYSVALAMAKARARARVCACAERLWLRRWERREGSKGHID